MARLLREHADLLEPTVRPALRRGGGLVRPDGYVACVANEGDARVLAAYLGRFRSTLYQSAE